MRHLQTQHEPKKAGQMLKKVQKEGTRTALPRAPAKGPEKKKLLQAFEMAWQGCCNLTGCCGDMKVLARIF
eukprot:947883-Pelagomonas_calceolata.AAC.3